MASPAHDEYDPRYLLGILHFNRGDYFAAHEVWEDLWKECEAENRRFVQALIHAAVAVYHSGRGNRPGTRRLLRSFTQYITPYGPVYWGLDIPGLVTRVSDYLSPFVNDEALAQPSGFAHEVLTISIDPAPAHWPDSTED